MNTIPDGTLVQILPRDKIDFSHYYLDCAADELGRVYWCMDLQCNEFGILTTERSYRKLNDGYYWITFTNRFKFTFHKSSFKVVASKELARALSI